MTHATHLPVLVYDGECNLCASVVGFVLPRDREGRFLLAARQSAVGQGLLQASDCPAVEGTSVALVEDGRCRVRSDAALRIAQLLPFPWPILTVLRLVPPRLRDAVYDWVARNRERWFGRRVVCLLSVDAFADRFLT